MNDESLMYQQIINELIYNVECLSHTCIEAKTRCDFMVEEARMMLKNMEAYRCSVLVSD